MKNNTGMTCGSCSSVPGGTSGSLRESCCGYLSEAPHGLHVECAHWSDCATRVLAVAATARRVGFGAQTHRFRKSCA